MRIALATVGTAGDVRPFAALARELVDRGHTVTGITWPMHADTLAVPGVTVEAAGPHDDAARIATVAADAASRSPMQQIAVLRDFHLEDGEEHYRQLTRLLPGHDLVLLHGIHALAHAAALDLSLPFATAVFDPVLLPTSTASPPGMPNLGPANRLAWWLLDRALARASAPLRTLLERVGSGHRDVPLFRARSQRRHLVACSTALVELPSDARAGTTLTGAWVPRTPPQPLPSDVDAFLAAGPPPVVLGFGSMSGPAGRAAEEAVRTLVASGERVVVQGLRVEHGDRAIPVRDVDHRALFPRAALVIHHGGAGTTHAACAAGVPSLVVPHVGDQLYWAERLHALGVAPRPLPARSVTASALADGARAAAGDAALRKRAAELAASMRTDDGVGVAAAALENFAAAG
jgi:UDP:flavonoid glycosyltransferase YjiC (YdhE family)